MEYWRLLIHHFHLHNRSCAQLLQAVITGFDFKGEDAVNGYIIQQLTDLDVTCGLFNFKTTVTSTFEEVAKIEKC